MAKWWPHISPVRGTSVQPDAFSWHGAEALPEGDVTGLPWGISTSPGTASQSDAIFYP